MPVGFARLKLLVVAAGIAGTAVAAFFGMKKWRQGKGQP